MLVLSADLPLSFSSHSCCLSNSDVIGSQLFRGNGLAWIGPVDFLLLPSAPLRSIGIFVQQGCWLHVDPILPGLRLAISEEESGRIVGCKLWEKQWDSRAMIDKVEGVVVHGYLLIVGVSALEYCCYWFT